MKKLIQTVCAAALLTLAAEAGAVALSLLPATQTAAPGDTVTLDLVIDGLGDLAPDSLSTFDVEIAYDSIALSFLEYTLGSFLGDIAAGDALDESLGDIGGGIIALTELSLLEADNTSCVFCIAPYLDDLQPGMFTLATLMFSVDVLAPGSSTVVAIDTVYALGDGFGGALPLDDTSDAVITARGVAIPEPAMPWLIGLGLALLVTARRV